MGKSRNFTGENIWARGYLVPTVGLDEERVRGYIRHQEKEDKHYEQLKPGI
ncbi:putative transposase [Nitrosomonas communis]|uniref:Putative transposase n=1 Tax=Nitrosomonas communis TaxID=44574 RepID=A0A5D3YF28_9PROT|nr:putative transposase [Nitrosomonas communis]